MRRGRPAGAASTTAQPLLLRRPEQLLERSLGDAFDVVARIDDQEVDRPDVAAGTDGRPEREDRAARRSCRCVSATSDARLRKVDELPQQVRGVERVAADRHRRGPSAHERDDALDVGDPCRPNLVFHADGLDLAQDGDPRLEIGAGGRARPGPASGAAPGRASARRTRPATPGRTTPVLHSGRRRLIYGIASAATPHGTPIGLDPDATSPAPRGASRPPGRGVGGSAAGTSVGGCASAWERPTREGIEEESLHAIRENRCASPAPSCWWLLPAAPAARPRRAGAQVQRRAAAPPSASAAASKGTVKIGIELPMSGGEAANGGPTANGVKLAMKQANAAGGIAGYQLEINPG